jgi:HrpA-like RNA helicase
VKENRYDNLNQMPTLTECWASKASAKQRRGRAGRVKPGMLMVLSKITGFAN